MGATVEMDESSALLAHLLQRVEARDYTIGIIGMGYVGLPLAISALKAGFRVMGFDTNPARVAVLNNGETGFTHISGKVLSPAIQTGRFRATDDLSKLDQPDALLIAVPTPITRQREPDLSFVVSSTRAIARTLRRGQLIVLESTTWPGTTEEVLKPILEETGLSSGKDFFLAFSPEREDPGNGTYGGSTIPKVVGADDILSRELACAVYAPMVSSVVPVSGSKAAEAVKLTENIFRSVNIALVNELKLIFERMDIDIWEVIEAAKTKPFGYMPFYPGPGLGGHCIPIDPFYLTWKAREYDVATRFIELAGEINTRMPHHVVERLAQALDEHAARGLKGAPILVIGLAYKKNIEDTRESPALKLMELLEGRGAQVDYHDPFVPVIPTTREHAALAGRVSVPLDRETLAQYAAVLIVTDHDSIDWPLIGKHAPLLVDTRNVLQRHGLKRKIVKA